MPHHDDIHDEHMMRNQPILKEDTLHLDSVRRERMMGQGTPQTREP